MEEEDIGDIPAIETDTDGESDRSGGSRSGNEGGGGAEGGPNEGHDEDDEWVDVEEEEEEEERGSSSEGESWNSASTASNDGLVNPFPWLPFLQWGAGDWGENNEGDQSDWSDPPPSSEHSDDSWETEEEEVVIGGTGAREASEDWDEPETPGVPPAQPLVLPVVEAYDAHIRLDQNGQHTDDSSSNSWETPDEGGGGVNP